MKSMEQERLNTSRKRSADPPHLPSILPPSQLLDVSTNLPNKAETAKAIRSLKSGKALGPDGFST